MAFRANMVINVHVVRNIAFTSAEIEFTIHLLPHQYKYWCIRDKLQGLLTMRKGKTKNMVSDVVIKLVLILTLTGNI